MRKHFFTNQFDKDQEVEKQNVLVKAWYIRHSKIFLVQVERGVILIENNLVIFTWSFNEYTSWAGGRGVFASRLWAEALKMTPKETGSCVSPFLAEQSGSSPVRAEGGPGPSRMFGSSNNWCLGQSEGGEHKSPQESAFSSGFEGNRFLKGPWEKNL